MPQGTLRLFASLLPLTLGLWLGGAIAAPASPNPNSFGALFLGYCLWAGYWGLPAATGLVRRYLAFSNSMWGCLLSGLPGCLAWSASVPALLAASLAYSLLGGGIYHFGRHLYRMS